MLWVAKIHKALSGWLDAAVELKLVELDSSENLLFDITDTLSLIVDNHPNDPRKAISDVALGSLATLALEQERHDGEAVESAMKLLTALFHGSDESRKQVRSDFFCKIKNPNSEDAAALERSEICLELLKVMERSAIGPNAGATHSATHGAAETTHALPRAELPAPSR